jgi:twinkle protein
MSNEMKEFLSTVRDTNRYICPLCSHKRKKKGDRTLSVTVTNEDVKYTCWHCSEQGAYTFKQLRGETRSPSRTTSPPPPRAISVPKDIDEEIIRDYLQGRSIDYERVKGKFKIVSGQKYFMAKGDSEAGEVQAIGFVYGKDEAVKWRPIADKRFIQDGSAVTLWGVEQIRSRLELPKEIILCEGEIDALSIASAVDIDVMSVPNGAPSKISDKKVDPKEDKKFGYLWLAKDVLSQASKVILVTDKDEAGEALKQEIARRVGRAKCYEVEYPEFANDPNDILAHSGAEALAEVINNASPLPLDGIYSAEEYADKVDYLFDNGMMKGESTGIATVDDLFTIAPGQLSVVTGIPGSGKSEFIDQLMINLAKNNGWTFAVASFENPPDLHIAKLSEKLSGKPFFEGDDRMTREEVDTAKRFINDHFMFVEQRSGDATTADSILDRIGQACLRKGIRGAVIDPYNYITQDQGSEENEHQFINQLLTRLVAFARAHSIHIWFVAHPAKMPTNADGTTAVPKGMNISGSASFFAKADLGVTVHRVGDVTEIHAWKVRFKWLGKVGMTKLGYDVRNGRYEERKVNITNTRFGSSKRRNRDDDVPF